MRTNDVYSLATLGWFGLVFAAAAVVLTGTAEPYVSPAQFPGEHLGVVAGLTVLLLAGGGLLSYLGRRAWTRAGRRAGLEPEGGGLVLGGRPAFAGRVRGRPVRVDTREYTTGHGENKATHTFTVVEAELQRPLDDGFLVVPDAGDEDSTGVEFLPGGPETVPDDAGFRAVGGRADAFAGELLDEGVREALAAQRYVGTLAVGDASGAVTDALPDGTESLLGGLAGEELAARLGTGDGEAASTVTHTTEDLLLDGAEMERQVEAVVTLAAAVEAVDAEPGRA